MRDRLGFGTWRQVGSFDLLTHRLDAAAVQVHRIVHADSVERRCDVAHRLIRLTAMTGHPVRVYIYETAAEMRAAGEKFNGSQHADSWGMTQAYADDEDRATLLIVRLCRESLGAKVVAHELLHAASAIYGAGLGERVSARAHFNHYNEPFTHLFSELLGKLNDRLWDLGYYGSR